MTSRLRVGYVVKRFPRVSETFIAQEILELERRGAEVEVFALNENDAPARHAFLDSLRARITLGRAATYQETWRLLRLRAGESPAGARAARRALGAALEHPSGKGPRYLNEAAAIAREASGRGIDHLHAHFANRPAFAALLAHLLTGLPFSFTAHAKDIYAAGPPPSLWRRQARSAVFVATVTAANRRHLGGLLGPRLAFKVRLLYNGVDLDAIRPGFWSDRDVAPRFLCVGRLVDKKGMDVLIDALRLLREEGLALPCDIVGEGPEGGDLRRRVADADLGGMVEFLGARSHEEVTELMRGARAVVLPCRVSANGDRDALPTVLLEGMAAGAACISTSVGGVPEIIAQCETGLIVGPDSARDLAEAIRLLARDPDRTRRMGEAGRRRAESLFDRRRNVAALHRWFAESAAESRVAAAAGASKAAGARSAP